MIIANNVHSAMTSSSAIRKAFEEGVRLRKLFGDENVYDFSLGNPDLEPPKELKIAMIDLASSKEKGAHGYMLNAGYDFVREEMAKKVSLEQGVQITSKNVVMTVGAAGGLNVVFKAILNAGDEIIVPAPFFSEYKHYANNHGGKLVPVPTKEDFSLDIEKIKNALSAKTAGVLINSPNNPTGKIYTAQELSALTDVLKEHGAKTARLPFLIADEPYRAITYDGKKVAPLFNLYANTVIVSSFAKNLSVPGERIGYVALNSACQEAELVMSAFSFANRILGYVNAPAFFQKVMAKSWRAEVDFSSYTKRRDALMSVLDNAGIEYARAEGAFYLFCKVPSAKNACAKNGANGCNGAQKNAQNGVQSCTAQNAQNGVQSCTAQNAQNGVPSIDEEFCEHLQKYHILAVPGAGFGKTGYFRLAYCVSDATIANSKDAFAKASADW